MSLCVMVKILSKLRGRHFYPVDPSTMVNCLSMMTMVEELLMGARTMLPAMKRSCFASYLAVEIGTDCWFVSTSTFNAKLDWVSDPSVLSWIRLLVLMKLSACVEENRRK